MIGRKKGLKMKKILIWGTGNVAKRLLENGICGEIIGYIESSKTKESFNGKKVYDLDEIPKTFDYIIVANTYVNEIYEKCVEKNIDINKVIFLVGVKTREGVTELECIRDVLGMKNYVHYCNEYGITKGTFFEEDIKAYKDANVRDNFAIYEKNNWPIIQDKYAMAGTINNYFWQDLWAAKKVIASGVKEHYDIGSRLDGFIAHLLASDIKVNMIDIRPFPSTVENLYTVVDDATMLENIKDNSIKSMSALCSIEHFGLGRYGDKIDPEACFKCFHQIQKKLAVGGQLFLTVPIGKERVEFNAHRVFYSDTVIKCFSDLKLVEYSCTAEGKIEYDVEVNKYDNDQHNGDYRYGLFHYRSEKLR